MKYDAKKDFLDVTDEIITGNSEILKTIASNIKEFSGDWDAVWNNVLLRGKIKERLVEVSEKIKDPDILEADFVIRSNDMYHILSDKMKNQAGGLDNKKIYYEWNEWLVKEMKKRQIQKNAR